MNEMQVNETLSLLRIIANSSTANKIALISTGISLIAVISSIYFSVKTRKQYLNSLNPLLSFHLASHRGRLYLSVTNTGQSVANNINLIFDNIENNGDKNKIELEDIFKTAFTLYPTETIFGYVAFSGKNMCTKIAPRLHVQISYENGNTHKLEHYSRTICYSEIIDKNKELKDVLTDIHSRLNEISYSNNRMANYFTGQWLLKIDELNVRPSRSLYQDIKDGINNIERTDEKTGGRNENAQLKI